VGFLETEASQVSSEGPSQLPAAAPQLAAQLGGTALLLLGGTVSGGSSQKSIKILIYKAIL